MNAAWEKCIQRSRIRVGLGAVTLDADLVLPSKPRAVVLHAGFGASGRLSPPTRDIVEQLARTADVAGLVLDLLTPDEEGGDDDAGMLRFEIPLLAQRLSTATDWIATQEAIRYLPVAYVATGSAAAAALLAASARREVRAIVSRAGRPDLAGAALENVRVPTLLLVAENDDALVSLNRSARARLRGTSELVAVRGPGDHAEMARRAVAFIDQHVG